MGPFIVEARKGGANSGESLDRVHKEHNRHHDGEYLKRVSRHVHHDSVHGDGLGRGEGDFPSLLEEQVVGIAGVGSGGGLSCGFLLSLVPLLGPNLQRRYTPFVRGRSKGETFEPPPALEKNPGGSGIDGEMGRGLFPGSVLKSMTQWGVGGGGIRGG